MVDVDHSRLQDISLWPKVPGPSVSCFNLVEAKRRPVQSVEGGNLCNCYAYDGWMPHIHGTHTEGLSHISLAPLPVIESIKGIAFAARLVTVDPVYARGLNLSLVPDQNDRVITREQLEAQMANDSYKTPVVIIRSPNFAGKETFHYDVDAPYPHHAIAQYLFERGVEHVILDFPSADRAVGELYFHRTFWRHALNEANGRVIEPLEHLANDKPRKHSTITELAFIPDTCPDGYYLAYLNPIGLAGDAAPVRPLIAPMNLPRAA